MIGDIIVWIIVIVIMLIIFGFLIKGSIDQRREHQNRMNWLNFNNNLSTIKNFNISDYQYDRIDIPVYYINLDRCPERNEHVIEQLQKHKVKNWKRIKGVDGDNDPSVKYTNNFGRLTPLSSGEIGCTLSHLRAIKTAYDDNVPYALILEDDVIFDFVPHWDKSLKEYIKDLKQPWNILQLYSNFDYTSTNKSYSNPNYDTYITLAYVINRPAMRKILEKTLHNGTYIMSNKLAYRGQADYYIYHLLGLHTRFLTNPPLFIPNNLNLSSTIHDDHTNEHIRLALNATNIYIDKIRRNTRS